MSSLRLLAAFGATLALVLAAPAASGADEKSAAKPAPSAKAPAAASKSSAGAAASLIEPRALQALDRMSAYLRTQQKFAMSAQTSLDLVTQDGQRIQVDGTTDYKVRRPAGFVIQVNTDAKKRTFIYDGKQFTLYAPELGYYATVDAPATNLAVLDTIESKFGIDLPLKDLFLWNDPSSGQKREQITSAFLVGPAMIDGVATEQYAFRGPRADWQIWIEKGDRPLPRKVVIVDRTDPALPAYTAKMSWTLNPTFAENEFTFTPAAGAKSIRLTAANP
jgi:hypothetical protein